MKKCIIVHYVIIGTARKITNTPKQFKANIWNKRRKIEDIIFYILYHHVFLWANPPTKNKTKTENIKHSEQNIKIEIT